MSPAIPLTTLIRKLHIAALKQRKRHAILARLPKSYENQLSLHTVGTSTKCIQKDWILKIEDCKNPSMENH